SIAPGEYYVLIISDTHGLGTASGGSSWLQKSTRANIGVYRNKITVEEIVPSDLVVVPESIAAVAAPNPALPPITTVQANSRLYVRYRVENQGYAPTKASSWRDYVYLSSDPQIGNDKSIGGKTYSTRTNGALGLIPNPSTLNDSWFYEDVIQYDIPINFVTEPTQFWLVANVGNGEKEDYGGLTNKENNVAVNTDVLLGPITITPFPAADLLPTDIQVLTPAEDIEQAHHVAVQWTVENSADAGASTNRKSWTDTLYYFAGDDLANLVRLHSHTYRGGALAPGESYNARATIRLAENAPANVRFVVHTVENNAVYEHDRTNNRFIGTPVDIAELQRPDLQLTGQEILGGTGEPPDPPTFNSGTWLKYRYTVANPSDNDVWPTRLEWVDDVFLSRDAILNGNDRRVTQYKRTTGLEAGESYTVNTNIELNIDMSGTYFLFVVVDAYGNCPEINEISNNDNRSGPDEFQVSLTGTADLEAIAVDISATDPSLVSDVGARAQILTGQTVTGLSYTVRNSGTEPAEGRPWVDTVYLSRDTYLDGSDRSVRQLSQNRTLAPGETYTVDDVDFTVPKGLGGDFYIIIYSDSSNSIYERGSRTNNIKAVGPDEYFNVVVPPPEGSPEYAAYSYDLQVSGVVVSTPNRDDIPVQPGEEFVVQWVVSNHGTGNIPRSRWTDAVYVSSDAVWDVDDVYVGSAGRVAGLNSGGQLPTTVRTFSLPAVNEGNYHIIVRTDVRQSLIEADEGNNAAATAADNLVDTAVARLYDVDENTPLQDGASVTHPITNGGEYYFRVDVLAGMDLQVDLTCTDRAASTELFVRFGAIPDPVTAEYFFSNHFEPDQRVVIPGTREGSYYILVRGDDVPNQAADPTFDLAASYLTFEAHTISPEFGGNNGRVTVKIDGAKFSGATTATLIAADGAEYDAVELFFGSPTALHATFDLRGAAPSAKQDEEYVADYDLKLTDPYTPGRRTRAAEFVLPDCFRVHAGLGGQLRTRVIIPSMVRPTGSYFAWIEYGNNGDQDIPAPLLYVRAAVRKGFFVRLSPNDPWKEDFIQILAINRDGPVDRLPPGSLYAVPISFKIPQVGRRRLEYTILDITNYEFDYDQLRQNMADDAVEEADFEAMMAYMQDHYGDTFQSFAEGLRQDALRRWRQGAATADVRKLLGFARDRGFEEDQSVVSGFLRARDTGVALSQTAMALVAEEGSRIYSDTTGNTGEFRFGHVAPGTYGLFVDGYRFSPPLTVAVDLDTDVIGLIAEALASPESSVPTTTPDEPADAHPTMCTSPTGGLQLAWTRGEQLWHAVWDGAGDWLSADQTPGVQGQAVSWIDNEDGTEYPVYGTNPRLIAFANADPSVAIEDQDGVAIVFESGFNADTPDVTNKTLNNKHLKYVLGRPIREPDGTPTGVYEWTRPYRLTTGVYGDTHAAVIQLPGADAMLTLFLQRDYDAEDDTDVYAKIKEVAPTDTDTYPIIQRSRGIDLQLDLGWATRDVEDAWVVDFEQEAGTNLPRGIPLIGGRYGYSIDGRLQSALSGCEVTGEAALGITVSLSDNFNLRGEVKLSGQWESNKKIYGEDCDWVFRNADLTLSLGGEGSVPGWSFYVPLLCDIELGAKVGGTLSASLGWQAANFPGWPTHGSGSFEIEAGPYGTASFFAGVVSAEVSATAFINVSYDINPPPYANLRPGVNLREWGIRASATAKLLWKRKTWTKQWPSGDDRGAGRWLDVSDDRIVIHNVETRGGVTSTEVITIEKEAVIGTDNVYPEDSSILLEDPLATTTDRVMDVAPFIAANSDGSEILAAWCKATNTSTHDTGMALKLASYDTGTGTWTMLPDVSPPRYMNLSPVIVFDSDDVPWMIWVRSDFLGMHLNRPLQELLDAEQETHICASYRTPDGSWSKPEIIGDLPGSDERPSAAAGPDGAIAVAWASHADDSGTNDVVCAVTFDGAAWSSPPTNVSV
ncbi:MAG: hypothetical protein HON70_04295, partial [Lentisphaerae bacterium]|nr:hypothetical protein [Lentisphaerota bacterium]